MGFKDKILCHAITLIVLGVLSLISGILSPGAVAMSVNLIIGILVIALGVVGILALRKRHSLLSKIYYIGLIVLLVITVIGFIISIIFMFIAPELWWSFVIRVVVTILLIVFYVFAMLGARKMAQGHYPS